MKDKLLKKKKELSNKIKENLKDTAPTLAVMLPGGAAIVSAIDSYMLYKKSLQLSEQAMFEEAKAEAAAVLANHAADYHHAKVVNDEEKMAEINEMLDPLKLERLFGEDGKEYITDIISGTEQYALNKTAEQLDIDPALIEMNMQANTLDIDTQMLYDKNLLEHAEEIRNSVYSEPNYVTNTFAEADAAADTAHDLLGGAGAFAGLGALLIAISMGVCMYFGHKQKKINEKFQKIEEIEREQDH